MKDLNRIIQLVSTLDKVEEKIGDISSKEAEETLRSLEGLERSRIEQDFFILGECIVNQSVTHC